MKINSAEQNFKLSLQQRKPFHLRSNNQPFVTGYLPIN